MMVINMGKKRNYAIGLFAWIATVGIVTSWQLATRWGVTTTLAPVDLALLRYGIPGVILAPLLWKKGVSAPDRPWWTTILIVFGGGLPFGLLGIAGAQFAPAAHMGALLPGSMPLFVAVLSAIMLGERYDRTRVVGLILIVLAVFCITWGNLIDRFNVTIALGDGLFLLAGLSWAVYTVAFRQSGLDAWHAAAIISGWSTMVVVPLWLISPSTGLLSAPLADVVIQIAVQGFLAGVLGMVIFGIAVTRLGPSATALSGAVVPAATTIGSWLFLSEITAASTIVGIAIMVAGLVTFTMGRVTTTAEPSSRNSKS